VYSPDGSLLAVGFGKPLKDSPRQFDGKWVVLRSQDLSLAHEARDSQRHIQVRTVSCYYKCTVCAQCGIYVHLNGLMQSVAVYSMLQSSLKHNKQLHNQQDSTSAAMVQLFALLW
jgi:hypothetical protein